MPEEQGYRGWKNYETWAVALYIDNDSDLLALCLDNARDFLESESEPQAAFADALHVMFESDHNSLFQVCLGGDEDINADLLNTLLQDALDSVNWDEISAHLYRKLEDGA